MVYSLQYIKVGCLQKNLFMHGILAKHRLKGARGEPAEFALGEFANRISTVLPTINIKMVVRLAFGTHNTHPA